LRDHAGGRGFCLEVETNFMIEHTLSRVTISYLLAIFTQIMNDNSMTACMFVSFD
jgi:hypothetical protein